MPVVVIDEVDKYRLIREKLSVGSFFDYSLLPCKTQYLSTSSITTWEQEELSKWKKSVTVKAAPIR